MYRSRTIAVRILTISILGLCHNALAETVTDLLKDNFYQTAQKTDDGPLVYAGLNYNTTSGIYASSNATFQEQGFIQDLSAGYSSSLAQMNYSFGYDATHYRYDTVYMFNGIAHFRTNYDKYNYRYSMGDGYRDAETSARYSVLDWNIRAYLSQTEYLDESDGLYSIRRFKLVNGHGPFSLTSTFTLENEYIRKNHIVQYDWTDVAIFGISYRIEQNVEHAELNAYFNIGDFQLSARINQNYYINHTSHRIHTVTIERQFRYVHAQILLSDAEPDLASSAFLVKYKRQIDF